MSYQKMARAYQSAVQLRSQREQDADVFEVFAARLRDGAQAGGMALAKALADNMRLWNTVVAITLDDQNPQPVHVRKSMLRLANSVLREMAGPDPDIAHLIETNGNIAAGLRGRQPEGSPLGG